MWVKNSRFAIFLLLGVCAAFPPFAAAQSAGGEGWKIPLLISDHHGDHALWLYRLAGDEKTDMILLDAHGDAAKNPNYRAIRESLDRDAVKADGLIGNHNWIHPLSPVPLASLLWISKISQAPEALKVRGFLRSAALWGMGNAACINLNELISSGWGDVSANLFVSIDLDFFYAEDYTPRLVPEVFEKLWEYSLGRKGKVLWAVCLSRAWLPDDHYAWELLEQSLRWLLPRTEFEAPDISLFNSRRHDTSRKAEAFRAEGREPPGFYEREDAMPDLIRDLFLELKNR
jgi:hypothetical protein